jgi:hypothetical protein
MALPGVSKDKNKNKAQEKKNGYADLTFLVLKEENGKPVQNASVVLHEVDDKGRQAKGGGIQLKTDSDGRAAFNSVPYGKVRVQVLIRGFQTFGEDYVIEQPQQEITVKLKPPQKQYSIYDK